MILQRQTYKFDATMYDRGVYNAKTTQAKYKYDLITEAIEFFKSLCPRPSWPGSNRTPTSVILRLLSRSIFFQSPISNQKSSIQGANHDLPIVQ